MAEKTMFALMNVLIKGTPASIQAALAKLDSNSYELKCFTFNPQKIDPADATIVKVGLIFEKWYEDFITPDEIPFAAMPSIKFIGLGNGCDGFTLDGSYVFYKDFGETGISECYQFSGINPQKEEFDAQFDVVDNVRASFMDHVWQYRYEDYSCGEYCPWAFSGRKAKALIAKWKSDEQDVLKKETKDIAIGGTGDIAFSYEHIDETSPSIYEGIHDGKDFVILPDEIVNLNVNGIDFVAAIKTEKKLNSLLKKFKKALTGKDVGRPLYNPVDVVSGKYMVCGNDDYGQDIYAVSDDAETLEPLQIAHRASLFAEANILMRSEKAMAHIIEAAPKKKNGTFALKRVTQIASLYQNILKYRALHLYCRKHNLGYAVMDDRLNSLNDLLHASICPELPTAIRNACQRQTVLHWSEVKVLCAQYAEPITSKLLAAIVFKEHLKMRFAPFTLTLQP